MDMGATWSHAVKSQIRVRYRGVAATSHTRFGRRSGGPTSPPTGVTLTRTGESRAVLESSGSRPGSGECREARVRDAREPAHGLTLVIPAFNEAAVIGRGVEEAEAALGQLVARFEVLVVADGSTDDTVAEVESAQTVCSHTRLIRHPANRGCRQRPATPSGNSRSGASLGPRPGPCHGYPARSSSTSRSPSDFDFTRPSSWASRTASNSRLKSGPGFIPRPIRSSPVIAGGGLNSSSGVSRSIASQNSM